MDWTEYLQPGEEILWQGRPAPRCYTFRNWKLAALGLLLFLLCSFWLMLGLQLVEEGHAWYLGLIPLPLLIASLMMGPGQLLLARIEWERLFYCLTERRLFMRSGLLKTRIKSIPLGEISSWQQKRYGDSLASVRIMHGARERCIHLYCLEQPEIFLRHLDEVLVTGSHR